MIIPKIIVQTSYYKPAKYIEENFKIITNGWQYYHFKDSEIYDFFEQNKLEEFPNPKEIFLSFQSGQHRADFFRYYFLYVKGGVYVDSDAMLEKNIDNIIEKYDFFTVKSCCQKESCFNGFIGSTPKHRILYKALKHIYNTDRSVIKSNSKTYFTICNELYNIIIDHKENCKIYSVEDKTKLFNEEVYANNVAKTLDDNQEIILKHYVDKSYIIPALKEIPDRKVKSPQETKIGVTFAIQKSIHSLFSNGINQNTLYFCELLHNIGYDLYIIINDSDMNGVNMNDFKQMLYDNKFKVAMQTDVISLDLDIFITFGYSVHELSFTNKLKYIKTKRVAYFCGNSYIIDSERILYDQHKKRDGTDFGFPNNKDETIYDEIWSIPQMANTNLNYWKIFYRCNCIEVPFIWSQKAIEFSKAMSDNKDIDLLYKNRGKNKTVVIFEPNISIMKWCLPSVLICENAYRKEKNIEHLYINNIYKEMNESKINVFNLDAFNKIIKPTDLYQNKKVSIEKRYNTLIFMSKYADIAVSHQWENPLNYLYFDLAWMGWPIVHNAHLCKDVGYYYEGFNYEMGAEVLNNVINNHDNNIEEYIKKNRSVLDRYLPSNKELQEKYRYLIDNLFIN